MKLMPKMIPVKIGRYNLKADVETGGAGKTDVSINAESAPPAVRFLPNKPGAGAPGFKFNFKARTCYCLCPAG